MSNKDLNDFNNLNNFNKDNIKYNIQNKCNYDNCINNLYKCNNDECNCNKYLNNKDDIKLNNFYNNINDIDIHSLDFDLNNLTDEEINQIPEYNIIDKENDDLNVQNAKKQVIKNQFNK